MHFTKTFFTALLAFVASVASQTTTQPEPKPCVVHRALPFEQEKIFEVFIKDFLVTKNYTRAYTHIASDMIQHNPLVPDGSHGSFNAVFNFLGAPEVKIQVLHRAFAAPIGWAHYRVDGYTGPGLDGAPVTQPMAVVDVFRFNGTCVQEHWDVIQERPEHSLNPHPLF
ncbi:Snoal-like polyketide cyclase family protein [Favolaschia claudopus]|uniref:Snoal-like polyketide cyclase family protein n=1 Tax=Favolaschia claudopus TaxID=2862362 RepID=A0AAW0CLQ0_9AGAR